MKKIISLILAIILLLGTGALADEFTAGAYDLPISKEKVTFTVATPDNSYPGTSYADGLLIENTLAEMTGIDIVWQVYPEGEYDSAMAIRLASGMNLPDIMVLPGGKDMVYKYATDGLIINMDELIEKYGKTINPYFEAHPDIKAMLTAPDGHIYTLGNIAQSVNGIVPESVVIRRDWLKKLGLEEPKTLEDFRNVLTAFVNNDPNGNGVKDEVGLGTYFLKYLGLFKTAFGMANFDDFNVYDGKVSFDPIDPRFKDYLEYMHSLYADGLMTTQLEQSFAELDSLTAAQQLGMYLFVVDYVAVSDNLSAVDCPDADWTMVLPPDAADGTDGTIKKRNPVWGYVAISKDCKNPDLAMQWLDFAWTSKEGFDLKYYGIKGQTYDIDENGNYYYLDSITHHESLTPHQAILELGGHPQWLLQDTRQVFETKYKGTKIYDIAESLAPGMTDPMPDLMPSLEEYDTYQSLWPDIDTYVSEMKLKFIMGTESLDNFDSFVNTVKGIGIDEILAIKQAQYDRFVEAMK